MARVHGELSERTARRVLLAVVLSTLGLLVLPAIAMAGYCGRLLARSSERQAGLPSFRDPLSLLAQGIKTWLVTAAFVLGAAVAATVATVLGGAVAGALGMSSFGVGDALAVLYVVPAVGLLALPTWVFTPVALTRVARTDEIREAFAWRPVLAVARRPAYLRRWARGVGFVVAGTGGYLYLSAEAALPWLVAHVAGASLNCCCQLVAFREFGRGYAEAADDTTDPAAAPTVDRPMWGERPDDWRRDREETAWGTTRRSD